MMKRFLVPAFLLACAVGTAQAGPVGGQSFNDNGSPSVNTGDINTATSFTIGDLITKTAVGQSSGVFVGMPLQDFGTTTFSLGTPTSLSFSSTAFGSFSSTSITEAIATPGALAIYVLGNYTPGTFVDGSGGGTPPFQASFTIVFTQTPAHTGVINDSATFAVPPAPPPGFVPEPSTLVMGLTSVVGGIFFHLRRRRRLRNATA